MKDEPNNSLDSLVEMRAHELLNEALSRSFKELYRSDRPGNYNIGTKQRSEH